MAGRFDINIRSCTSLLWVYGAMAMYKQRVRHIYLSIHSQKNSHWRHLWKLRRAARYMTDQLISRFRRKLRNMLACQLGVQRLYCCAYGMKGRHAQPYLMSIRQLCGTTLGVICSVLYRYLIWNKNTLLISHRKQHDLTSKMQLIRWKGQNLLNDVNLE